MRGVFRDVLLIAALLTATLAVYWPVQHYSFIEFDDPMYVTDNEVVQRGQQEGTKLPFLSVDRLEDLFLNQLVDDKLLKDVLRVIR